MFILANRDCICDIWLAPDDCEGLLSFCHGFESACLPIPRPGTDTPAFPSLLTADWFMYGVVAGSCVVTAS